MAVCTYIWLVLSCMCVFMYSCVFPWSYLVSFIRRRCVSWFACCLSYIHFIVTSQHRWTAPARKLRSCFGRSWRRRRCWRSQRLAESGSDRPCATDCLRPPSRSSSVVHGHSNPCEKPRRKPRAGTVAQALRAGQWSCHLLVIRLRGV